MKRKHLRRLLLAVLISVILCCIMLPANAAGNPYPAYNWWVSDSNYEIACTWYAWQQVHDQLGIDLPSWGNGGDWYYNAIDQGYSVGSTPKVGAIACYSYDNAPPWGHVSYVTEVYSDSSCKVVEGGRGDIAGGIGSKTITTSNGYWPDLGFIYAYPANEYLDLNWIIDGAQQGSTTSDVATADVYINGNLVADDVSDYYQAHPIGSTYEIKDIKTKNGYVYLGSDTALSGTLQGWAGVVLKLQSSLDLGSDFYAYIEYTANGAYLKNENGNVFAPDGPAEKLQPVYDPKVVWHFERQSDKTYKIVNEYDGYSLEADYAGTVNHTNVLARPDRNVQEQRWFITKDEESTGVDFVPAYLTDFCLDKDHAGPSGDNIQLYPRNDCDAQRFAIRKFKETFSDVDALNNYAKPAAPDLPKVMFETSSNADARVLWTESKPKSAFDSREYTLLIYQGDKAEGVPYLTFTGLTATSQTLPDLPKGTYTAAVCAINTKYPNYPSGTDLTETVKSKSATMDGWTPDHTEQEWGEWGAWSEWQEAYVAGSESKEVRSEERTKSYWMNSYYWMGHWYSYYPGGGGDHSHEIAAWIVDSAPTLPEGAWHDAGGEGTANGYIVGGTAYIIDGWADDPGWTQAYFKGEAHKATYYQYRDRSLETVYYFTRVSGTPSDSVYAMLTFKTEEPHTHTYNKQVTTDTYLASAASCTEAAKYYYSCECGEKGASTFSSGSPLGHNYVNGECTRCHTADPDYNPHIHSDLAVIVTANPSLSLNESSQVFCQVFGFVPEDSATGNPIIEWSSTDSNVIRIVNNPTSSDTRITITAVNPGTATIGCAVTAKYTDGSCYTDYDSVTITVESGNTIQVSPWTKSLNIGEGFQLNVSGVGTGGTVRYSSSNESVATVNSNGYVVAHNAGNATITAEWNGMQDACAVHVESPAATGLTINSSGATFDDLGLTANIRNGGFIRSYEPFYVSGKGWYNPITGQYTATKPTETWVYYPATDSSAEHWVNSITGVTAYMDPYSPDFMSVVFDSVVGGTLYEDSTCTTQVSKNIYSLSDSATGLYAGNIFIKPMTDSTAVTISFTVCRRYSYTADPTRIGGGMITLTVVDSGHVATGAKIEVGSVKGILGKTIQIPVRLVNNPGVASVKVSVAFDTSKLEYSGAAFGADFTSMQSASYLDNLSGSTVILTWLVPKGKCESEDFAVLTFKVKSDAATGSTPLTLTFNPNDVFDEQDKNVAFTAVSGSVNVISHVPGDLNGDSEVNNKDVMILLRHLVEIPVDAPVEFMDVNGDHEVNNKDLMALLRYTVGIPVELV